MATPEPWVPVVFQADSSWPGLSQSSSAESRTTDVELRAHCALPDGEVIGPPQQIVRLEQGILREEVAQDLQNGTHDFRLVGLILKLLQHLLGSTPACVVAGQHVHDKHDESFHKRRDLAHRLCQGVVLRRDTRARPREHIAKQLGNVDEGPERKAGGDEGENSDTTNERDCHERLVRQHAAVHENPPVEQPKRKRSESSSTCEAGSYPRPRRVVGEEQNKKDERESRKRRVAARKPKQCDARALQERLTWLWRPQRPHGTDEAESELVERL
eukprot:scaffold255906_cov31-Tisochrysis_lutea.AAC.1